MPTRGLQAEIGKKRPFEDPAQEAYLNVLRTAGELSGPFVRLFRRHGLRESTYNVLRILRGSGSEGRTCGRIARDMIVRVPDVTRLVDRLEAAGLVARRECEQDRRVVHVVITATGNRLLARLDEPVARLHAELLSHMTRAELEQLSRLLVRARSGGAANDARSKE